MMLFRGKQVRQIISHQADFALKSAAQWVKVLGVGGGAGWGVTLK